MSYNRQEDLKGRINAIFSDLLKLPNKNYYDQLSISQLLGLKSALKDINNAMTMHLSLALIKELSDHFKFNDETQQKILGSMFSSKPSSNGYDIIIEKPVKVICEVKCNIPVNGGKTFGAAQIKGLSKDVNGLLGGKKKAKLSGRSEDYIKILALPDEPNIRSAAKRLFEKNQNVKICNKLTDMSVGTGMNLVYIVFIEMKK